MTTAEKAKALGFKSLNEVAEEFGVTTECLRHWDKQGKFNTVLLGCAVTRLFNILNGK